MTLTIDLTPIEEEQLFRYAHQNGVDPASVLKQLVQDYLPSASRETPPTRTAANDPAIALFESWLANAPTDPEAIRQAEADRQEFMQKLNENRIASGERPLFP